MAGPDFDPGQPFDVEDHASGGAPQFDASQPFETEGGHDAGPSRAAPPDKGGLGRNFRAGFTEGITGIPSAILDPASKVVDSLLPFLPENEAPKDSTAYALGAGRKNTNPLPAGAVTHSLNEGLGLIGLNPEDVPADTFGEKVARMAGTGATSVLFPEGGAEALASRAATLPERVTSRAANTPVATLARRAATGTAVGTGAGAAGEAVPDSMPELKAPVQILTAIALGGASELPGMVKAGVQRAKGFAAPFTEQGQAQTAADIIRDRSSSPALLASQLDNVEPELVPGSKPTTFQQTGDMGLGSLEREQATKQPQVFNQRRADQNQARQNALSAIQEGGDPAAIGTFLRGQFRNFDDQAQQHIDALTAHAQQKTEGLGGSGHPEEHGAAIRAALQDAENAARARERSLWRAVDPDNSIRIDASPTYKAAKEIEGGMSRFAKPMDGEEAAIHESLNGSKQLSLGELADLRSRVSTAARNEMSQNGQSPAYARLIRLRGAIQNNLADAAAGKAAQDAEAVASGQVAANQTMMSRVQGWVDQFYGQKAAQSRAGNGAGFGESAEGRSSHAVGDDGTGLPPEGGPGGAAGNPGVSEIPRPLTERQFYDQYAQHIDLRGRKAGNADQTSADIAKNGFRQGANVNAVPPWRGGEPRTVVDRQFAPQQGDTVYLAPKGSWKDAPNGMEIQSGWKPKPWEVIKVTNPKKSMYENYLESFNRAHAPEDGAVPTGPRAITQDDADKLAQATKATKERAGTFGQGPTKQVLAKAGMQDVYKLPEARVPEKFFHAGPTSHQDIQTLRQTVGDQAALPILRDYAAASLRKFAETADGTLDPRRVRAWQTKYGNALRSFPELSEQFSGAARATEAIADAAASQKEAIAQRNASALGRIIKAETPEDATKTVGSLFNRNDSTKAFRDIAAAVAKDPQAKEGLRQAVANHIAGKLISNTEAGTSGANLFKADQFQTFVKQNRAALSAVFSPEEMKTLDAIAADLHRANRSITAVKLPGGSNTAQDLHGATAHDPNASIMTRALSEAAAAGVGAKVGNATGAGIGWLGAKVANAARAAGMQKVDDLVTQALLDPAFARDLLRRAPARANDRQSVKLAARLRRIGLGLLATNQAQKPQNR